MSFQIVTRFYSQAREIALGQVADFNFDPSELLEIVEDPGAQALFEHELRTMNDQAMVSRIKVYIRRVAETLEREEATIGRRVRWFSGTTTQLSRGSAIAGGAAIVATVAAGITVLPATILFGCGLVGMIVSMSVENRLEVRADDCRFKAKRLREMVA